ncbi:MAG TPA: hypothetical protein VKG80_21320 [Trebonia sp.]|nr:hypothetical protein [Trebonia sp.]
MASSERGQVTDEDAAARQAAEVAVELSEAEQPEDRRRVVSALNGVARSAGRVLGRRGGSAGVGTGEATTGEATTGEATDEDGTGAAGRGAGIARRSGDIAKRGAAAARRGASRAGQGARQGAGTAGRGATSSINWLSDQVMAMGPRLRIRDQATLRAHFPGYSDDQIADLLIDRAARAAGAVGAATGAWGALPVLPAWPAEVAAETLATVGIEIKLVAELHEIYGVPAVGSATERARAYIGSWAHRRGIFMMPGGVIVVAAGPLARQLRRRLLARVRRSTFSLSPLFTGALVGAVLNSRETRRLGHDIRRDLHRHPIISAERASGPPLSGPRD